jgi:Zn-dependent peptidase ImmA (M78 family)
MNEILKTIPDIEIINYVDMLLYKTAQYNEKEINLPDTIGFLKLDYEPVESYQLKLFTDDHRDIRGILDINERLIITAYEELETRKKFSIGHEIGHFVLPDHREQLYLCSESDMDYWAHLQMEKDANEFSAKLLFKGSFFNKVILDYHNFDFNTIKSLVSIFNNSITATIRAYVENSEKSIAVLFLNVNGNTIKSHYVVPSKSFEKLYFKKLFHIPNINSLLQARNHTMENPYIVEYQLTKATDTIIIKASFFYNQYNIIGLLEPDKEI